MATLAIEELKRLNETKVPSWLYVHVQTRIPLYVCFVLSIVSTQRILK